MTSPYCCDITLVLLSLSHLNSRGRSKPRIRVLQTQGAFRMLISSTSMIRVSLRCPQRYGTETIITILVKYSGYISINFNHLIQAVCIKLQRRIHHSDARMELCWYQWETGCSPWRQTHNRNINAPWLHHDVSIARRPYYSCWICFDCCKKLVSVGLTLRCAL